MSAGVSGVHAMDAATIQVDYTPGSDPVGLVAQLETVDVSPDESARIVINERTGTVVLGGDVTVTACAIAQGNLTVRVADTTQVSQPNPFTKTPGAQTIVVPKHDVNVDVQATH